MHKGFVKENIGDHSVIHYDKLIEAKYGELNNLETNWECSNNEIEKWSFHHDVYWPLPTKNKWRLTANHNNFTVSRRYSKINSTYGAFFIHALWPLIPCKWFTM